MLIIDGSYLEGGGQIVRTALALSMITQQPFQCTDIRKGRKDPGLKPQHLTGITTLVKYSGARCDGAELGSDAITFYPRPFKPATDTIDIGTAGSITLLLQSLLLPCMLAAKKTKFTIIGGTDVSWSPSIDYLIHVLTPQLQKYAKMEVTRIKRGYYPRGGGQVEISITPLFSPLNKSLAPRIELIERGRLVHIKGVSHCSKTLLDAEVADRQMHAATFGLTSLKTPVHIDAEFVDSLSTGSGITLWATYMMEGEINKVNPIILGVDYLGKKGTRSEEIGSSAAQELLDEISSGACVDKHMEDQLIPFLGVFGGEIKVSQMTQHTKTNIYVTEKFLKVKFERDEEEMIIRVRDPFTL